jgi:hypothetical protein
MSPELQAHLEELSSGGKEVLRAEIETALQVQTWFENGERVPKEGAFVTMMAANERQKAAINRLLDQLRESRAEILRLTA